MSKTGIVFPHQLFEQNILASTCNTIYLIEEWLYFRQYNFHKRKIAFHRSSMKFYESYLQSKKIKVVYIDAFNESILKATGKYWEKWFSIILKVGGKKLSRQEIVLVLHKYLKGTGWWEQMITVQFDKKYKNRALYQSGKTFKVSISKVFNFPIERVFDSWINKPVISKWLTNKSFTIRKSTS